MDINDVDMRGAYYTIPTGLSAESIKALLLESESWEKRSKPATVIGADDKLRSSKTAWLTTDHWVAGMMAHLVREANRNLFRADLTTWASQIQYTRYDGVDKDYYGWHHDTAFSDTVPGEIRKISISLLLSDPGDYEGGELQFNRLRELHTLKPALGDAIIFPSQTPHRVRPVKNGVRKSLVGWFGGPLWR